MSSTPPSSAQYVLDLPHRPALGRDDFLVTDANQAAAAAVERWPDWRNPVMIICGPAGSGKSHLAAVWLSMTNARQVAAADLQEAGIPELLSNGAVLIEDAPSGQLDERALFHAINLAREEKRTILITSRSSPAHWPVALPDLVSRLKAAEVAYLEAPDDVLLRGVLIKQFADRQIAVDERIIGFMVARMERSFDALRKLVAEIDRRALTERAEITRPFVSRVMADLASQSATPDE
ncbi:MAG: hypothetical protein HKN11_18015 [Rhizobiales bacterium]|nr:hypothetical protein [Hyphomicrobiales bacterium]